MTIKTNDPQLTVQGKLKQGTQGELICFSVRLMFFELACIVNIPADGEDTAPVYCKFKVRHPEQDNRRPTQTAADRNDD